MATQTPERDNTHEEADTSPPFSDENLSQGYSDDQPSDSNQTTPQGTSSGLPPNSTRGGSVNYGSGGQSNPWGNYGGSSSGDTTSGRDTSGALSRSDLGEQERSGSGGSSGNTSSSTGGGSQSIADKNDPGGERSKIGGGQYQYRNEGSTRSGLGGKLKVRLTRKRVATFAILGIVGGGGIFTGSILTGPAQLVHLSQILQKSFKSQENTSSIRTKGLWRFHKTKDVGETRVGKYGSNVFKKATEDLKEKGIEFKRDPRTGRPLAMTIDPLKDPNLRDLTREKQEKKIAKQYKVDQDRIGRTGAGRSGKLTIDMKGLSTKQAQPLVNSSLQALGDGRIVTGIKTRTLGKFFNMPGLFSPLKKVAADKEQKISDKITRRQANKEEEKKRAKERKAAASPRATAAKANLKEKLTGNQGKISAAVLGPAALCIVNDVADSVIAVNRESVAVPAAVESVDKTAIGAQVQSGNKISQRSASPVANSFTDENGKTIFSAKALQALAGKKDPGGEDISVVNRNAFSNDTTAQKIKDTIGTPSAVVCSTPGLVIQGGINVAILVAAVPTAGGSVAVFAAKQGTQIAAAAGVIYLLQKQFAKLISDDALVELPPSGPAGGNILAYGSREAANISSRASGGVELGSKESAALDKQLQIESKEEFQSRSFASRIFDTNDHRSLISSVIDQTSTSPTQNLATLANSFSSAGKGLFSNILSTFMPKAYAASELYDWGFPQYGIPGDIVNDAELEDPYDNADKVAAKLDGPGGNTYVEKVKKCFGVDLEKGADGWDVTAKEDVDPHEEGYVKEKCNDFSDPFWKRVIVFVFDTRLMASIACYDGNEEACSQLNSTEAPAKEDSGDNEADPNFKLKKLNPPLPGARSGGDIDPKGITLHWWGSQGGGGIDPLVNIFKSNGLSVQVGITSDGEAYQLTKSLLTKTSHAIGGNSTTIGIEIEGGPKEFGKAGIEKYPKKFDAVVKTVQYLKDKYNIPVKKNATCNNASGILQHSDFNKCPGAVQKDDIDDYYYNEVIKRVK